MYCTPDYFRTPRVTASPPFQALPLWGRRFLATRPFLYPQLIKLLPCQTWLRRFFFFPDRILAGTSCLGTPVYGLASCQIHVHLSILPLPIFPAQPPREPSYIIHQRRESGKIHIPVPLQRHRDPNLRSLFRK